MIVNTFPLRFESDEQLALAHKRCMCEAAPTAWQESSRFDWRPAFLNLIIALVYPAAKMFDSSVDTSRRWTWAKESIEGETYVVIVDHRCGDRQLHTGESGYGSDYADPVANHLSAEDLRIRAALKWEKIRSYMLLTRIFREIRQERKRDPSFGEFLGFLQLPVAVYNWRNPNRQQIRQIREWTRDPRLSYELYTRTKWLADELLKCSAKSADVAAVPEMSKGRRRRRSFKKKKLP